MASGMLNEAHNIFRPERNHAGAIAGGLPKDGQ